MIGDTGAITWSLSKGTLSSTGLISGTAASQEAGLSLTFQAKDSATNQNQNVIKVLPLTINNALDS